LEVFQQPTTSDQRPIRAVVARILDFQEVSKAHSSGAPVLFVNARASSPRGFDAVALKSSYRPMPPPSAFFASSTQLRFVLSEWALTMHGILPSFVRALRQGKAIGA